MNEMEEFLNFGAVVKIRKEYEDIVKLLDLIEKNI